ncbi:sensor histidine kinase [Caldicellulosiruptor kronotskyensis]|uniref:sensor histidine kinase n=1 Tax=Caldicellulosiruptor kronotskyensis TaxID=413889 RepID=UPI001ED91FA7|nr:histidine kinase [Caldicellulosiruptor kronotskyensis]
MFLLVFLILDFAKTEYLKSRFFVLTISFVQFILITISIKLFGWEFSFFIPCSMSIFWDYKNKLASLLIAFLLLIFMFFVPANFAKDYFLICIFVLYSKSAFQMLQESKQKYIQNIDNLRLLNLQLSKLKTELLQSQQIIQKLSEQNQQMKLASSLHDTVGHSLAAINIQLNALKTLLEKKDLLGDEQINHILSSCLNQTQVSYKSLRNFVYSLKNSFESKTRYLEKVIEEFNFCKLNLNCSGDIENIPSYIFENLMAILKEALVNVSKHSDATFVDVSLQANPMYVRLYIHDNGTKKGEIKEGIGLMSIKLRSKAMNATINIDNSSGFSIVVFVPLKSEGD